MSQLKTCLAIGLAYQGKGPFACPLQLWGDTTRHNDSYLGIKAARPDSPRSVTRNLRNLQVSAPLRSKYMYCNLMYTVASYLVEKISGLSFADFLQTHFFKPIGMGSTHLQPEAAKAAGLGDRITTPYVWNEENKDYQSVELQQCPEAQGAGSIMTSVDDYLKWVKTITNKEAPISDEIYKSLIKPRIFGDPDDDDLDPLCSWSAYAAGWEPYFYRGSLIISHEGAISGFGTIHFFLPREKFGGVLFGNSNGAQELTTILAHELIDEALNVPGPERPDWDARFVHKRAKYDEHDEEDKLKKQLRPDFNGTPEPQKIPLSAYTGEYWNAGYHGLLLETKDDRLYVNAVERYFYLTFEHVCNQTMYIAHLEDYWEGGDDPVLAEFRFKNDKVVKMGLKLELDLDGLIWFDKVDSPPSDQPAEHKSKSLVQPEL